jgi:hypothetical protein
MSRTARIALLILFTLFPVSQGLACVTLSIAEGQVLSFGIFAPNNSGSVIIDTNGNRSATGGVYLLGGSWGQGRFDINGDPSCTYAISLPTSVSLSNGAQTMTVDTFESNPSTTGQLDGAGYQQLEIGATLRVNTSQQDGNYNGIYTVIVNYN